MTDLERPLPSGRELTFRDGIRAGLPLALPALLLAISFGVLARSLGWGIVAPIVCSILVFAGSAQFAAASVLGAGGGVLPAVLTAVMVNGRFLAMGFAIGPALKGGPLRRAAEGQTVVDASWALSSRGDGTFSRELLIGATIPQYLGWQTGTVIGVLFGDIIGDPERLGLDAIFPAFFLSLLVLELRRPGAPRVAVLAGAMTLALIPITPAGVPTLAAAAAALLGLRRT